MSAWSVTITFRYSAHFTMVVNEGGGNKQHGLNRLLVDIENVVIM